MCECVCVYSKECFIFDYQRGIMLMGASFAVNKVVKHSFFFKIPTFSDLFSTKPLCSWVFTWEAKWK